MRFKLNIVDTRVIVRLSFAQEVIDRVLFARQIIIQLQNFVTRSCNTLQRAAAGLMVEIGDEAA